MNEEERNKMKETLENAMDAMENVQLIMDVLNGEDISTGMATIFTVVQILRDGMPAEVAGDFDAALQAGVDQIVGLK